MTLPLTPAQSEEIDDRIVEMIIAVLGEGEAARRCRVIANRRYLDSIPEIEDRMIEPSVVNDTASMEARAKRLEMIADQALALVDNALAAVDRISASIAWQQIADAPVDCWVLAYCPDAGQRESWPSAPWIIARREGRGTWYDYGRLVVFPTHWMELGAPLPVTKRRSLNLRPTGWAAARD